MEQQTVLFSDKKIIVFSRIALAVLIIYLTTLSLGTLKGLRLIGAGVPATNTISVSGSGEVFAVADTAEFTVSVMETAKDVKSAQSAATTKANDILSYLKQNGVDEKDIKTTDYSISPQYDYERAASCVNGYCPPGKQVLTGYKVNETLSVKVRDIDKAGELLAGVSERGVSQVSGLNFTIADQTALENEARDKAIAEAKTKAKDLAKSLGVSLVRVVGYGENSAYPMPYAMKSAGVAMDMAVAAVPEIAVGQNKITANITISYEIQ